jgi:ribosomal-protein-serine acetyltransferase
MTSQKLFLRPLTEKDAPELCKQIMSTLDSLHPWMDWAVKPYFPSYSQERIFSHQIQWRSPTGSRAYGIFCLDSGTLIGEISVHHINMEDKSAQLGYWICADYQRKAFMREAVILLVRYLIDEQKLSRIYVYCEAGNIRSLQLPRALGFIENPLLKDFTINLISKLYNDVYVFSRTSTEGLPDFPCVWSMQPFQIF